MFRSRFHFSSIKNNFTPVSLVAMYGLSIHQANKNKDFCYLLQRGIEPEKPADKKIPNKAIEVMRLRQDFFQPLAQGVVALIGQEFFRGNWRR